MRQPLTYNQLVEKCRLENELLNNIYMNEDMNKEKYTQKETYDQYSEYYYTDNYHFMREENYTINGDPVINGDTKND